MLLSHLSADFSAPSSRPQQLLFLSSSSSSDASPRLAPQTSFNADKRFSQPLLPLVTEEEPPSAVEARTRARNKNSSTARSQRNPVSCNELLQLNEH